jgi:DNA-binding transcriptional ArsR family regulator
MVEQLLKKSMIVNDLTETFGKEQSMVSHNLKLLFDWNFAYIKPQGKKDVYKLNKVTINPPFKIIENHTEKLCSTGGKCLINRKLC